MRWSLQRQTEVKHQLLIAYFGRWFPIMAQRKTGGASLLYVDGFSGPGRYSGGEPGSPLIVLQEALSHPRLPSLLRLPNFRAKFAFIEGKTSHFENLRSELLEFQSGNPLPRQFAIIGPLLGEFDAQLSSVLSAVEEQRRRLEPAFVFIDPFGPAGFPMRLIGRILANRHCEVLIRFNYTRLANTFVPRLNMEARIDDLYATEEWREARAMRASRKEKFLIGLYLRQLRGVGNAAHTQPFRTTDRRGRVAHFIFCTNNCRGMEEMKEAMWKIDPEGLFHWEARREVPGQTSFLGVLADDEYVTDAAALIAERFSGQRVPMREVQDFIRCEPNVLQRHLRPALQRLETSGQIANVELRSRPRIARTFPDDCTIWFV